MNFNFKSGLCRGEWVSGSRRTSQLRMASVGGGVPACAARRLFAAFILSRRQDDALAR